MGIVGNIWKAYHFFGETLIYISFSRDASNQIAVNYWAKQTVINLNLNIFSPTKTTLTCYANYFASL